MDRGAWQAAEHEAAKSQTQLFIPLNSVSLVQVFSHIQVFATPWTVAHQAALSMEFPRQEYWSGVPFPPPGDLPDPGIELASLASLQWRQILY